MKKLGIVSNGKVLFSKDNILAKQSTNLRILTQILRMLSFIT